MKLRTKFAIAAFINTVAATTSYMLELPTPLWVCLASAAIINEIGLMLSVLALEVLRMECWLRSEGPQPPNPLADLLSKVKMGTIDSNGKPEVWN